MASIEIEFAFATTARIPRGSNPQRIGEYLENLRIMHGGTLTPAQLVEDARDRTSPLHPWFEWSNTKAATQYRLNQARHLVQSVEIRYRDTPEGGAKTTRAFINLSIAGRDRSYHSAIEVMSDAARRDKALRAAWRELQAFRAKYRNLQEFATLFADVAELERSLPPLLGETIAA